MPGIAGQSRNAASSGRSKKKLREAQEKQITKEWKQQEIPQNLQQGRAGLSGGLQTQPS